MPRLALLGSIMAIALCAGQVAAQQHLADPSPITLIEIDKSDRKLVVYVGKVPLRTFQVALGFGGPLPKVRQGDGRVPEGLYRITAHNPHSAFHKSLRISYPTEAQRKAARAKGYKPGGDIMMHGLPNGQGRVGAAHRMKDWTAGCIALTDEEIDWLYPRIRDGTPILIRR